MPVAMTVLVAVEAVGYESGAEEEAKGKREKGTGSDAGRVGRCEGERAGELEFVDVPERTGPLLRSWARWPKSPYASGGGGGW